MYVVVPLKRLRVVTDWSMWLKPMAERTYTTITVHQIALLGSGQVIASCVDEAIAHRLCTLLNSSSDAEEIVTAIRLGFLHGLSGYATAEVLEFPKRG